MSTTHTSQFGQLLDLASEKLGGEALAANDEFFAEKECLVRATAPVFLVDKYTDHGKWMDGWETRRRREPGYDWAIVKLGVRGALEGVDVDTAHFVGNFPESCSVEGCDADGASVRDLTDGTTIWRTLVPQQQLAGGSHNEFAVDDRDPVTHLRLNIFPDGGVARLHAYGTVQLDWAALREAGEPLDLGAAINGAFCVTCNDMFFCHKDNLILPGEAANMGEGWETRRRRGPGNDWIIVRLAHPGAINQALIDTSHYKGNFPDTCSLEGCNITDDRDLDWETVEWTPLMPQTKLSAHTKHEFVDDLVSRAVFTHVRLSIYPDGGVARLRLYGVPDPASVAPSEHSAGAATDTSNNAGAARA